MTFQFGKALSGGRPIDEGEVRAMRLGELHALKERLARPEPTDDVLDRRLAEELAYSERLLEIAEAELRRRSGGGAIADKLAEAETVVASVGGVVEAKDRCEGIARAAPAVRRRLLRDGGANAEPICRR